MAILGKIREKSIVLILVIGMALFAFVISGVFDGAGTMSQEPVAIVGDEKVNIEQFSRRVDAVERNTGMSNVQAVNTVWDQVVTEYSFDQLTRRTRSCGWAWPCRKFYRQLSRF